MTDHTTAERAAFEANCAALPEGVSWGDALTPAIVSHIRAAQSEPATRAVLVAGDASIEYAENLRDVWEGKPLREKKKHRWDTDAERCLDCGQSEYIGGECIPTAAPTPDSAVPVASYVDIVFDGPPRHESGRFVEVESPVGRSINFGEWIHRDDGYWALRFTAPTPDAERHVANHAGDLAARDVLAERARQVSAEGWTPEHDDTHDKNELSRAAACYALEGAAPYTGLGIDVTREWANIGWSWAWWKPKDRRRNLVKAGALILAEIERLDRAAPAQPTDSTA